MPDPVSPLSNDAVAPQDSWMTRTDRAGIPVPLMAKNPIVDELLSERPIVDWLLPDFIPAGSLIALAGSPGAGKSFICYSIGMALACGLPILGLRPPYPVRVLYFDCENAVPDRTQYERWIYYGLAKPNLEMLSRNFWCLPFTLGGAEWANHAEAAVKFFKPELVIFDTTTPCCNIQDENDNAEAARVVGKIRSLMTLSKPSAACICIKHAKVYKDSGQLTLRGAKTWEGAVDSIVYVRQGEGRPKHDGWSNIKLEPAKKRAFALQYPIHIKPRKTDDELGMILEAERLKK